MRIRVYTRSSCGYCTSAKRLLDDKGVAYEEIDTTGKPDLRAWLQQATGRSTVPQIFFDERSIGGYDDLAALDRRGELDRLSSSR
jgi:glutaredoxin 3